MHECAVYGGVEFEFFERGYSELGVEAEAEFVRSEAEIVDIVGERLYFGHVADEAEEDVAEVVRSAAERGGAVVGVNVSVGEGEVAADVDLEEFGEVVFPAHQGEECVGVAFVEGVEVGEFGVALAAEKFAAVFECEGGGVIGDFFTRVGEVVFVGNAGVGGAFAVDAEVARFDVERGIHRVGVYAESVVCIGFFQPVSAEFPVGFGDGKECVCRQKYGAGGAEEFRCVRFFHKGKKVD